MARRYSMVGGVSLPGVYRKAENNTRRFNQPNRVILLVGGGCRCMVKVGDKVLRGQAIGRPVYDSAVPVYASVSGEVVSVGENADGCLAVEIKNDGRSAGIPDAKPYDKKIQDSSRNDLIDYIRSSAICSDAGVPLYRRILDSIDRTNVLLLNCVETEPGVRNQHHRICDAADQVINGAKILMKTMGIGKTLLVIDDSCPAALRCLNGALSDSRLFDLKVVRAKYPQQDAPYILRTLGKAAEGFYSDVSELGYFEVSAVECAQLYRVFLSGMPVLEQSVTVSGVGIDEETEISCPFGTDISELLFACTSTVHNAIAVIGGPMRGKPAAPGGVVTPKTCAIYLTGAFPLPKRVRMPTFSAFLDEEDLLSLSEAPTCIRCGACVDACPERLLPNLMLQAINRRAHKLKAEDLNACTLCGCCSYVCPAELPLAQVFSAVKKQRDDSESEIDRTENE